MLKPLKSLVAALGIGLLVSSCQTSAVDQKRAELTFAHLEPLTLNVSSIEIENSYKATPGARHMEERFPTPPAKAMARWVRDRLKPVGDARAPKARLVITDASVIEAALKQDKTITGTFTRQQTHRYDMAAGGRLEIVDGDGSKRGYSAAKATRSFTTTGNLTLNEREKIWFSATEKLMAAFDREMESNIRQHLGSYLK